MPISPDASQPQTPLAVESPAEREGRELRARLGPTSRWRVCFQIAAALLGNGVIVWLVDSAQMTPLALIILVAVEAVLLVAIWQLQLRFVPRSARDTQRSTPGELILGLAFTVGWLGAFYGILLIYFVPSEAEVAFALSDPWAFAKGSSIAWPLLITLAIAGVDALQDAMHFARAGGTFVSTPKQQGMARTLTLFFGGIPFLIPIFAAWIALIAAIRKVHAVLTRDASRPNRKAIVATLMVPSTIAALWVLVEGLRYVTGIMESDAAVWALCFCASKFVSELLIIAQPHNPSGKHVPPSP